MRAALLAAVLATLGPSVVPAQPYYPPLPSMVRTMTATDPLLDQLAAMTARGAPIVGALSKPVPPIVIDRGIGGRVDEHRLIFAGYQRRGAKVEVRGPCYSACTLVLAYVEPANLCIGEGAFMAFHAVRSMEYGAVMPDATRQFIADMPLVIRMWVEDNGGWRLLPRDGYWTMHDRQLWARGYPKCS